jgi:threonine-phosphate decarboxylase
MPQDLKEKMIKAIDHIDIYPEISGITATNKIASDLNVENGQILLGNGGIELIYLFARSFSPVRAIIVQPTFNEYERAMKLYGSEVFHHILQEENQFKLDLVKLHEDINQVNPDVVFFCNPTNPSSAFFDTGELKEFISSQKNKELIWFVDESFIEFTGESKMTELLNTDNILLLRSLTKFYAMPGIRIGYLLGMETLISKMAKYKEPWTVNSLALTAAENVYNYKEYKKETITYINKERKFIKEYLDEISNLKYYPSYTDFFLCRTKKMTNIELQKELLKEGVYIRTCNDFVGLGVQYFRFAIKNHENNEILMKSLKKVLGWGK